MELLPAVAEASITLAGFAAVFKAFGGPHMVDGHSNTRLNSIVELGLAVALLSFLPTALSSLDVGPEEGLRILSVAGGVYYLRWLAEFWAIRHADHRTPKAYLTAVAAALVVFVLFWLNALGLSGKLQGTYLLAILIMFFLQGLAFMAQIRAEQGDGH